jgi:hypothetical protein
MIKGETAWRGGAGGEDYHPQCVSDDSKNKLCSFVPAAACVAELPDARILSYDRYDYGCTFR